ncbi:MAG: transpeptidase family protein [Bacteroidales bacterium]|nr:transpeptidase family protein [Candidatus Physcousia equi]
MQTANQHNKKSSTGDHKRKRNMGTGRFRLIFYLLCGIGVLVIFTALKTMIAKRGYWEQVKERFTKNNIIDPAVRGNLYDCNGKLLVGSVPEYRLCLDFRVIDKDSVARTKAQAWRDSAFVKDVDSIAEGLNSIFPEYSTQYFHNRLMKGFNQKKNGWSIVPRMATFIEYKQVKELPLLRETPYKGGFHGDEKMMRKKPYGSLASRTLGQLWPDSDRVAKNGIELAYDSILRGRDGVKHNTKVRNTRVDFSDQAAVDGNDIMTTIDVDIQDVAEKALEAQLKAIDAEMGVVIVMEAATGDVKAIVNLSQLADGDYAEIYNYAISECMEPGSTFKTASLMAALEDGKVDTSTVYDTGCGVYMMHGRPMKDASWATTGGYGKLSVKRIIEKSSNVGVSRMIDENYGNNPKAFTDALRREGAGIPLDLPLAGSQNPTMKTPENKSWSKTTLAWMSIGYESLLPPISTCTFYNGIANGGVLVAPRFVKAEMQDGMVVREFPVRILRDKMCSEGTLKKVRETLENVVSAPRGTGKKARCPQFRVAGKTGTAQIAAAGGKGYHSGTTRYFVSFCGFFPYENPKYTCFVGIRKYGLPASGGGHCAPVFSIVAQAVMASGINHRSIATVRDSTATEQPRLTRGDQKETELVLNQVQLRCDTIPVAVDTFSANGRMPDVVGMGARDAVYMLQRAGVKAKLSGGGRVERQSIAPGTVYKKGVTVDLKLK